MSDNHASTAGEHSAVTDAYEPPAIEVLGTVEDLTRGPNIGDGDDPTGVISF